MLRFAWPPFHSDRCDIFIFVIYSIELNLEGELTKYHTKKIYYTHDSA